MLLVKLELYLPIRPRKNCKVFFYKLMANVGESLLSIVFVDQNPVNLKLLGLPQTPLGKHALLPRSRS